MIDRIQAEADRAKARYGDYTSTHEALGVLVEEMDELREAIRSNMLPAVEREAIQVAAVALRLAEACHAALRVEYNKPLPAFMERSTK